MKPINFFYYLEREKGLPIPLMARLFSYPDSLRNIEGRIVYKGDLDLGGSIMRSLPEDLTVKGDLYMYNSKIGSLPKGLQVFGDLVLSQSTIERLPSDLEVRGTLDLYQTKLGIDFYSIKEIRQMVPKVRGRIVN